MYQSRTAYLRTTPLNLVHVDDFRINRLKKSYQLMRVDVDLWEWQAIKQPTAPPSAPLYTSFSTSLLTRPNTYVIRHRQPINCREQVFDEQGATIIFSARDDDRKDDDNTDRCVVSFQTEDNRSSPTARAFIYNSGNSLCTEYDYNK